MICFHLGVCEKRYQGHTGRIRLGKPKMHSVFNACIQRAGKTSRGKCPKGSKKWKTSSEDYGTRDVDEKRSVQKEDLRLGKKWVVVVGENV